MNTDFLNGLPIEVEVTFRLLLAYVLGGLIGWDRERDGQPAGLRTHMLVSVGAAGFTLLFIYGFKGVGTSTDAARAASQIITGIGFLGAGAIWRSRTRVRGVTTAADIWVVASIGMLAAAGLWYLSILLSVLVFFTLRYLKPNGTALEKKHLRKRQRDQQISRAARNRSKEVSPENGYPEGPDRGNAQPDKSENDKKGF
ncbi:MAG TPA: MgtC/SapB family protein [Chloroflexia bacterium]|nr:MgtC/SapB family protein [Chloroflexia bacterium]